MPQKKLMTGKYSAALVLVLVALGPLLLTKVPGGPGDRELVLAGTRVTLSPRVVKIHSDAPDGRLVAVKNVPAGTNAGRVYLPVNNSHFTGENLTFHALDTWKAHNGIDDDGDNKTDFEEND